jgi:hypothetical protein
VSVIISFSNKENRSDRILIFVFEFGAPLIPWVKYGLNNVDGKLLLQFFNTRLSNTTRRVTWLSDSKQEKTRLQKSTKGLKS